MSFNVVSNRMVAAVSGRFNRSHIIRGITWFTEGGPGANSTLDVLVSLDNSTGVDPVPTGSSIFAVESNFRGFPATARHIGRIELYHPIPAGSFLKAFWEGTINAGIGWIAIELGDVGECE